MDKQSDEGRTAFLGDEDILTPHCALYRCLQKMKRYSEI